MELLLNLAWLLLALPAYWLWREGRTTQKSSLQCLLSLACLLVILFPVISATDDLQAMRTEMEESSASKRTLRQSGSPDKSPLSGWHSPSVASPSATTPFVKTEDRLTLKASLVVLPPAPDIDRSGRAPPSSSFLS